MSQPKRLRRKTREQQDSLTKHCWLMAHYEHALTQAETTCHYPQATIHDVQYTNGLASKPKRHVVLCKSCNVNLCLRCYQLFHVAQDLVRIKARIRDFYLTSEDKNETYPLEEETPTTPPHQRQEQESIQKKRNSATTVHTSKYQPIW
jgi:hypothetical protein